MALMIEIWGEKVLSYTPALFKLAIRNLPEIWRERKTYLMHEYQNIKNHQWRKQDYADIGIPENI